MSRKVVAINYFKTRFKRLSKKFKSLNQELATLANNLLENPKQGNPLGNGLYKIRLASKSKSGGKSGGFRVITYYIERKADTETIYLVTIYDKSEEGSIDKADLEKIIYEELE